MEEIEVAVRPDRADAGVGLLDAAGGFVAGDKLGLPLAGVFLTPSESDARGRVLELVGETAVARIGGGFDVVEDDKLGFVTRGADAFGTTEALLFGAFPNNELDMLVAIFGTMAGLADGAEDELADFLIGEAGETVGLVVVEALGAADFTAPEPNVPELIIYHLI